MTGTASEISFILVNRAIIVASLASMNNLVLGLLQLVKFGPPTLMVNVSGIART